MESSEYENSSWHSELAKQSAEIERLKRRLKLLADGVHQRLPALYRLVETLECSASKDDRFLALDIRTVGNMIHDVLILGWQPDAPARGRQAGPARSTTPA